MLTNFKKGNGRNAIVFVHGLNGNSRTWLKENGEPKSLISELLGIEKIKSEYDFWLFEYPTSFFNKFYRFRWVYNLLSRKDLPKKNLNLDDISSVLESEISTKLHSYNKIAIIAHSMGGIIAKSCIVSSQASESKIGLYLSLAAPHNGSVLANIAKNFSSNKQLKDLATLNSFIDEVNREWLKPDISRALPKTIYFLGKSDEVVKKESSLGYESRVENVEVINTLHNHFSIIDPKQKDDIVLVKIINTLESYLKDTNQKELKGSNVQPTNVDNSIKIVNSKISNSFNKK